jgi:DNA-binding SARP family transcriptional activator
MEFGLLGPLRLHDGHRTWPVPAAKQRIVLATLLLREGAVVGVDELMHTVWDGLPPEGALIALRNHVMRLRRAIGPQACARLHTRAPGYLIEVQDGELDSRTFIQLRDRGMAAARTGRWEQARTDLHRALDLWRGDPLLDVPSERLHGREGRRLAELRLDVLRERIDADLQMGEHEQLVAELNGLVREHPLREGFHAQLMLALYRAGRQSEALAAYQHARGVLIEDIGVEPGRELTELHQRVLALDPTLQPAQPGTVTLRRAPAAPAAPDDDRAAPAQLPADLADFTGRSRQIAQLGQLLRQAAEQQPPSGPGALAVVTGAGGIGKTTLAIRIAHQLRDRFPDGQLYVDLRGTTDAPLAAEDVVARLLRDLGVDASRVPADPQERDSLYRSILADRRVLIVLDDARDTAQVRPLIPGSVRCAVIITSRHRLSTLPTSGRADLDILEPDDASALIGRIIGAQRVAAEPDAVQEVLRACAGLPLAIRISAARLVARPTQNIRSFADRLTDARARLDQLQADDLAVRATFAISYTRLPAYARSARAFRLLGLWSGPDIGASAAGALLGQPHPVTDHALDTLIDAQLLQNPAPGRYRLHDLLGVYARERAQQDELAAEREAAVRRLLTWYLHTAANAELSLRPHRTPVPLDPAGPDTHPLRFDDYHAALDWCQSEQANLVAAVRAAEAHGLPELGWRLALALWSFYYITKRREDWLATSDIGLRCARLVGDERAEGALLSSFGTALCESRRYDEAIERYEQALVLHRVSGDQARQPGTLNSLAVAYGETGRYAQALEAFDNTRKIHVQLGDAQGEGLALTNMAQCYLELGRFDEAVGCNHKALAAHRAVGDRYCEAICLANLGDAHARAGAHQLAVDFFTEAIAAHREAGNRHGTALTLLWLGQSRSALGQRPAARESWREAHAIFVDLGEPDAEEIAALLAEDDHVSAAGSR